MPFTKAVVFGYKVNALKMKVLKLNFELSDFTIAIFINSSNTS